MKLSADIVFFFVIFQSLFKEYNIDIQIMIDNKVVKTLY